MLFSIVNFSFTRNITWHLIYSIKQLKKFRKVTLNEFYAVQSKYNNILLFRVLKKYFDITTTEVIKRLLHSLIPFNPKFFDISAEKPDLYGPFWIYTCLIFIIAAAGSLSRYFQGSPVTNFFEGFVPIAAGVVYGIGFGVPLVLILLMKLFGSSTSYPSCVCIYGYSYSIYIPIVLCCAIGVNVAQWILLTYAAGASTSFILVNYWKEMGKYIDRKRYILIVFIIGCQAGLFLVLKLYFFETFTEELSVANTENNNNSTANNTNSEN